MRKALITGGGKFIGSHLAEELMLRNYEVHITTSSPQGIEEKYNVGAAVHVCDIRDFDAMMKLCEGVDYIFHFASHADQACIDNPIETESVNVGGAVSMLEVARRTRVKKFIFASSAMVYGDQKQVPLREDLSALPVEPYGLYKYFGERLMKFWAEQYAVPTVTLRFFNVYGPRDPVGPAAYVIGRLLDRRINKLPLTIDGDGTDTRDYIHVTDVVRACIIAAEHPDVSNGELFNIATGIETSLNTLAAHIGGKVIHLPNRSGSRRGPNRRVADILHAKTVLGWVPNITIEEGIQALKNDLGIS